MRAHDSGGRGWWRQTGFGMSAETGRVAWAECRGGGGSGLISGSRVINSAEIKGQWLN